MSDIYNQAYFDWQRTVGEFGGKANQFKFAEHVRPTDIVLDFGCGGGYLLKNLDCNRRIGVEINPAAASIATESGVACHASLDTVPNATVDIVISNHALEHVRNPLDTLQVLRKKLMPKGVLVIVVPCESTTQPFDPNDINQHIYTWNPQLLGNLAMQAGFEVVSVSALYHKWPANFLKVQRRFGWRIFHLISRLKGLNRSNDFQVKLVARNPSSSTE
jgi:SAM-dependent methyltransferase